MRQQLDSYDSFLKTGLQDCMADAGDITYLTEPNYAPGSRADESRKKYRISFDQVRPENSVRPRRGAESGGWVLPSWSRWSVSACLACTDVLRTDPPDHSPTHSLTH